MFNFDLDHAAIMQWITDFWAFLNASGIAVAVGNLGCGVFVYMVMKSLFEDLTSGTNQTS